MLSDPTKSHGLRLTGEKESTQDKDATHKTKDPSRRSEPPSRLEMLRVEAAYLPHHDTKALGGWTILGGCS